MSTDCTLKNREGDVLVNVSLDAEQDIETIKQVIESCYRSEVFDKLLWNWRYVELLGELKGVTPYTYDLNTGEVLS